MDHPREVGADRIVKAVAALTLYTPPLIIIDFGTATTFDCINARGEFVGGAIAPGIATAADALLNRAARLFRVELVRPKDAIGRNTVHNVQSGIVYGWAGLVDGLVERMKAELDGTPRVIATGGHAALIVNVTRSHPGGARAPGLRGFALAMGARPSRVSAACVDTPRPGRYTALNLVGAGPSDTHIWGSRGQAPGSPTQGERQWGCG